LQPVIASEAWQSESNLWEVCPEIQNHQKDWIRKNEQISQLWNPKNNSLTTHHPSIQRDQQIDSPLRFYDCEHKHQLKCKIGIRKSFRRYRRRLEPESKSLIDNSHNTSSIYKFHILDFSQCTHIFQKEQ